MSPRRTDPLVLLLAGVLLLLSALALPALGALAQTATPGPKEESTGMPAASGTVRPAASSVITTTTTSTVAGTPTMTRTPTITPSPTATLTARQGALLLAQTYLQGGDYSKAAGIFAAIAREDPGNPDAIAGLKGALAQQATATAPTATTVPSPATTPVPTTFGSTFSTKWREFAGTALPGLLLIVLLYLLAQAIRWFLQWLRELWFMRILPLLHRPAVPPGYVIGEFSDATGIANFMGPQIVSEAITEKLLAWNQLIQFKEIPVETSPSLDLGGMSWIKVLWNWILPPPRGYKVNGLLHGGELEPYRLAVKRIVLSKNAIDASHTFDGYGPTPGAAFGAAAGEAAKWLLKPDEMEGSAAVVRGLSAARGAGEPLPLTASEIFDQALELLLPVRQQVNQGAIDYADARGRLRSAQALLLQLPETSSLRIELQRVLADLQQHVPGV